MASWDHEDLKQPVNKRTAADRRRSREASITFTYDLGTGKVSRTLLTDTIKVGNLSSAALRIDHSSVGRMHAYIQRCGDEFFVSDLGSAHGTYLDGQRVNKAKLITGSVLRIGEVDLEVQIGDEVTEPVVTPEATTETEDSISWARALGRVVGAVMQTQREADDSKKYYCEICFNHRGNVREMDQVKGDYQCPHCGSRWKLNRGQAHHQVALKLRQYRRLATLLGMPDEQT